MKGFLSHYTPSLMNPEDLDAIFVQRQPLLTDLLENIERSVLTEAKHHALLIGPRGIGKTHLISMIYHRVSANETFKNKLKIAWLREEEWGVATFLDLLVRILNALIDEYQDQDLEAKVKDLYSVSTEQAEQLAGQILKQYCQNQTLLLLMENLDEIFKGLDESGQQAFRAYLQNHGFITIVATSQSLFSGVKSRDLPFYGFFSLTHLKPLVLEEAVDLLANIARWRGDKDLADLLLTTMGKSRIRAIHHLAGGNHRIYIIFSQFLTTESLDSLVEPFMKTLDDLTPFYQSRMQFISPQQRKIIEYLCEQRGAIVVKEIAQHCFISQQTASSQLKQLREMGYVYADAQGRESFYELQEPLMRICLEAKKRRGTPNQLFISFLRVWFSRDELENRLENLPLEAVFDRECTIQALAEMETSDDPQIAALLRDWNDAKNNAQYQKMLEVANELILIRNSGMDWIKKAESYYWLGQRNEALKSLDKATDIEPKNAQIWSDKGDLLSKFKSYNDAIQCLNLSLKINPKDSFVWINKAMLEAMTSNFKEANKSIKKTLQFANNNGRIFHNIAVTYDLLGNQRKALEYSKKAINVLIKETNIQQEKNNLLKRYSQDNFFDNNEFIKDFEEETNLNPNSSESFQMLAILQFECDAYEEALTSINKSLALFEFDDTSWHIKGSVLFKLGSILDALECFDKSLQLQNEFFVESEQTETINKIKSLAKYILAYIFLSNADLQVWSKNCQQVFEIYKKYDLLRYLGFSLTLSIAPLKEPSISDHTAQAWLEMWQNLAGQYDEFQVALNLLKVAVEYKINRDRRVLLQLPQEERQILEELLNPETV